MSTVKFSLFTGDITGGLPSQWPEGVAVFEKIVDVSFLPTLGMHIHLSNYCTESMDAEVDEVTYDLELDLFEVELEMAFDAINMPYFLDPKNGWKPLA